MAAANGGRVLDQVETRAYQELFASCEHKPLVTSIKGAIGESFSGGGIRACALALSVEKGWLPPTIGLSRPLVPMDFVMGKKKIMNGNQTVLAGISFGGTYAYLILSGWKC
jgi:3-oxoacyl-(acyl-carrier-protein) synthase